MANTNVITIEPENVAPVFGDMYLRVLPHLPETLPPGDSDELNDLVRDLFEQHIDPMPMHSVSASEAFLAFVAINTASSCAALGDVEEAMAPFALEKLGEVMAGGDNVKVHTKADALSRLDWIICDIEEYAEGYATPKSLRALRQLRRDINLLIPRDAVVDCSIRPAKFTGPTVGELGAVEKAFTKIGRTVEEAHDAVGYKPASRGDA